MQDPILMLGNALIYMDNVECKGEKNHDYLLSAMQNVRAVCDGLKEAKKRDSENGQRENV